jgi:hypothetical protein
MHECERGTVLYRGQETGRNGIQYTVYSIQSYLFMLANRDTLRSQQRALLRSVQVSAPNHRRKCITKGPLNKSVSVSGCHVTSARLCMRVCVCAWMCA